MKYLFFFLPSREIIKFLTRKIQIMRIMKCITVSMFFVLHTAASAQNSVFSTESYWVGEFKANEMNQMFKIRFEKNGSTVNAIYQKRHGG